MMRRVDGAPSRAVGQVGILILARTAAYVLGLATPVFLARRLTTDDFGTYREVLLIGFTIQSVFEVGLSSSLYYFLPSLNPMRGRAVTHSLAVLGSLGIL